VLTASNPLSALKVIEENEIDGIRHVLLSFRILCQQDKQSTTMQKWFRVHVDDSFDAGFDAEFVRSLMLIEGQLPWQGLRNAEPDASLPAWDLPNVPVPLSEAEELQRKAEISKHARKVSKLNDLRFASYHPVKGYRLHRDALAPISPFQKKDHLNHYAQKDFKGERAAINAAADAMQLSILCRHKERKFKSMVSALQSMPEHSRGISPHINCWLDAEIVEKQNVQADIAAAAAWSDASVKAGGKRARANDTLRAGTAPVGASAATTPTEHLPTATPIDSSEIAFHPREYAEITGAQHQSDLNGHRVRLYSCESAGMWVVSVLGCGGKKFLCHERFLKKLSTLEQQRSVPTGAQMSFEDVGIDAAGQPNIELKSMAHRQFGSEYSAELTKRIEGLRSRFSHVFTEDVSEPCEFEAMKIKLIPNAVLPSKAKHYRNTPKMREEVRRQIQEQLSWGAIRKCVTPCVSDVLLVKRPHMPGKFRFVVNYVKLNEATVKEQLLMPDAKSQHERLAGCTIFGAIDFSSYYRQIRLHEDSQYLTGFASDEGTYCYTRVPMGVTGACQWAQKVLQDALAEDEVLGPLGFRNYFDDLPFGAKTEDEFMRIMEALLNFCAKWKLKVNPSKSVFGVTSITHVGFVVSANGISIDPERTSDISALTAPKSLKKVQSVLGIMNYVRNFIPGFSMKAKFLTDKLALVKDHLPMLPRKRALSAAALSVEQSKPMKAVKKVQKFIWTDDDDKAFEELKLAVLAAPLLEQLDYEKPIYIRCDASRFGAGAVLFQYDDRGFEHPVCYASRKFLPSERNWSTFSQEASTVVWALERFAEYTQGYHVIVECDHRNISFVKKSAMPQLARWRLRLQDMDFCIRFLSGARNETADGLSRQHVDDEDVVAALFSDVIPECSLPDVADADVTKMAEISAIDIVRVAEYNTRSKLQPTVAPADELVKSDPELGYFSDASLSSNSSDDDDDVSEPADDVLLGPNGELLDDAQQFIEHAEVVPEHLQLPVFDSQTEIKNVHNDLSGHAGAFVTLQRVLRNSRAWGSRKQMIQDIDAFILACPCCQKMKKRSSKTAVDRRTISGSPFSELSVDLLSLKADAFGYKYVAVIVDSFSHWTSLVAIKNKSAFDTARALMQVIGNFGAPLRIRSDGGSEFVNAVIVGLQRMMGVTQHVVTPYTPTANGIVERANRSILTRLREMIFCKRLVQHPEHVWSDLLPLVQRALNASVHSAIGTSPARVLFGDNLDLDRCLLTSMPNSKTLDVQRYVDALTFNQRVIIEAADLHQSELCAKIIAKSKRKQQRKRSDGQMADPPAKEIAVGDWVLVQPSPLYPLQKLAPRWLGPFLVHECSAASEVVVVKCTLKNKLRRFLKRQLERFDVQMLTDAQSVQSVAESDGFEFPVDSICGHALIEAGGVGASPVQLPSNFKRGSRAKKSFQFLVKWTGYDEPSWIDYRTASRLVQFPGYVSFLPNLRMD
jgi:transposase InsO family protein